MVYNKVIQSYMYMCAYIFFQVIFDFRLLHNIEHSSLCCTAGPCCFSVLYIVECICEAQTPELAAPLPLW